MSSIPVAISRFSDNNFKRFYLKKKTHFVDFWLHFSKCPWSLENSEEKEEYPSLIITEIIASNRFVYLSV